MVVVCAFSIHEVNKIPTIMSAFSDLLPSEIFVVLKGQRGGYKLGYVLGWSQVLVCKVP